jgi:hypothetical protein
MAANSNSTATDRLVQIMLVQIIDILQAILQRLDTIERDVDTIDRTMRPYGDGSRDSRSSPRRRFR